MISADDFDAYNRAVSEMSDGLAARAEAEILAWMRANPGASVEECRERAKEVMSGMAQVADEAAATLAAEWYDAQAEAAGARLEPAVTASVYSPETVDKVARYQARKLAKGDAEGFARRCGELVRNDALRSLNETVIANVGRDRDRGARFARVMTGAENCEFCLMLASRGAVYHTRETAGEFRRFHRGCDCKVVPGFSGDPMEALVEGHDPKDAYERYEAIRKGDGHSLAVLQGPPKVKVSGWSKKKALYGHSKKHAADFGIDYRSKEGQEAYSAVCADIVASCDSFAVVDDVAGQKGDRCVVCFKGEYIAVANTAKEIFVSAFKHRDGVSEYYDRLWREVRGRP